MKDLIILGVGVHGAEMVEIVERINAVRPTWRLLGLIAPDRRADQVGQKRNGCPVLGTAQAIAQYPQALFVPDNEYPNPIDLPRARLATIIDPSTFVSRTARVGAGCVIYPHCYVGLNAALGDRVFSLAGAVINHDDFLEDRVVLCSNVSLAGHVHVEHDCYLGQGCTVKQYLRIGQGSLIGMGAVVVKSVEPNTVVVGNPAMRLRGRKKKE